ncbi:formate dehydrogenase, partial [Trifolium medium]|nr:formate dehydrogenase [Trifolium medium]
MLAGQLWIRKQLLMFVLVDTLQVTVVMFWFPQPAPKDHPWCYMPNHAMTPHISGTTIDAQV